MKASFRELWWLNGSVDRGTYAVVGALAFAVNHNLDRIIATYIFHRPWGMFNYWVPLSNAVRIMQLSHNDAIFLTTMLAIALPFVWLGVAMTLKRLRGAGLPNSLVVLFFAPFLNLGFFLLLCVWPERGFTAMTRGASRLAAVIPSSTWGSAAFSFLFTIPFGLVSVLFATRVLTTYGWSLFVALPFTLGMAAALVHGVHQPRTLPACIAIACLFNAILGLGLLALAWEGVICLAMAAPIAIVLASFGGACGYLIQRRRWRETPIFASVLFAFVPGLQWFEHALATPCPVLVVRSVIEIQAPPEELWRQVTSFSEIPPPTDFIFRVGVAYPIRAEILGNGPGAERHCV